MAPYLLHSAGSLAIPSAYSRQYDALACASPKSRPNANKPAPTVKMAPSRAGASLESMSPTARADGIP